LCFEKSAFGSSTRGHRFDTLFANGASKVATPPITRSTYCYQVTDLNGGSHLLTYTVDNASPALKNEVQKHYVSGFRHYHSEENGCDFSKVYQEIDAGKASCAPGWLGEQPTFLILANPTKSQLMANNGQIEDINEALVDMEYRYINMDIVLSNEVYRWSWGVDLNLSNPGSLKFLKALIRLKTIEVVVMPCGQGIPTVFTSEIADNLAADLNDYLAGIEPVIA
jgi:hypothetical protein